MNSLKNAVGIPVRYWADGPWSFALRKKGGEDVNIAMGGAPDKSIVMEIPEDSFFDAMAQ